ncbi:MAG: GrpB family protein, partial [Anaerolineae bacterium]|nr:GrpB family protein [Anaerolineae bacterium]
MSSTFEPIVVDYDPAWPTEAAALIAVLAPAVGTLAIAIHHVGSTAIPGMIAKPVLDIDIELAPGATVEAASAALATLGYAFEGDKGIPDRYAYGRPSPGVPFSAEQTAWPAHHLYVCPHGSAELARHLVFRDRLRASVALREEYTAIKREALRRAQGVRQAYVDEKERLTDGFIWKVLGGIPTLDAHAHLRANLARDEVRRSGAVLALTLSLDEAERALARDDSLIVWGVGCYPGDLPALMAFDKGRFREMAGRAAVIGEVGLDAGRRPPLDLQLQVFRAILEVAAELSRPLSIHSADLRLPGRTSPISTASMVLDELERTPLVAPILHWWTGSADETSRAVALGCYFSVHSQVARRSQFRTRVPPERILV